MNRSSDNKQSLKRTKFLKVLFYAAFVLILLQCLAIFGLTIRAGNNGYHDPRHFSIDIGGIVSVFGLVFLYVTLLLAGILAAAFSKNWIALVVQALIPVAIYGLFLTSIAYKQLDKIKPEDYPNLVGRNIREVRPRLDTIGSTSGFSNKGNFLNLRDFEIISNSEGIITEVNPRSRN